MYDDNPISREDHISLWGEQQFYRVFSLVNGGRQKENDLFEGIEIERFAENPIQMNTKIG